MDIAIKKLFAQLLFWLYDFIDAVFECFQVLAGTQTVDGDDTLIDIFLGHDTVTQVFLGIFVVSIAVAAVCTGASIVKSVINMKGGERKSHAKTLGQGFGSILITVAMAIVMLTFITASNTTLGLIQQSFGDYDNMNFSSMLFDLSVEGSYVYDYSNGEISYVYVYDENGDPVYKPLYDEYGNIMYDEYGNIRYSEEIETEIEYDSDGNIVYNYELVWVQSGYTSHTSACARDDDGELISETHGAACIDFSQVSVNRVFGVHGKVLGLFESSSKGYTTQPMVELDSFNFFTAYLVVIIMLVVIIWAMLGLVKRIFDIMFLFLSLPLITATIPLDDGARFKTWRDTVLSKVILAWAAVFSINIFMLIVPIINQLNFSTFGFTDTGVAIFKIFLMIGSALAINGGQLLAARLMGTDASDSREMAQGARALLGGAGVARNLLHGAKVKMFGGKNKYGEDRLGFFPQAARGTDETLQKTHGDRYINSGLATALHKIGKVDPGVLNALRAESYGRMYGGAGANGSNTASDLAKNITAAPKNNSGAFRDNNNKKK